MAKRTLGKYLLLLGTHPDVLQMYLNDPDEMLKKSGLSAANQKLLKSNDLNEVLAKIREEEGPEPGDFLMP